MSVRTYFQLPSDPARFTITTDANTRRRLLRRGWRKVRVDELPRRQYAVLRELDPGTYFDGYNGFIRVPDASRS